MRPEFAPVHPNPTPRSRRGLALRLGFQDLRHDWRVSAALALSIVSVLAPLLLLLGLKAGVLYTLREILLKDPRNLEVLIFENTRLSPAWFEQLRADTERVRFVIPGTRTLSAVVDLENRNGLQLRQVDIVPTAVGDPLLPLGLAPPDRIDAILLTHPAAAQLAVSPGERVKVWITRTLDGIDQRESLELTVAGIVPEASLARPALFTRLEFLEAVEDYKEGYAAPALLFGREARAPPSAVCGSAWGGPLPSWPLWPDAPDDLFPTGSESTPSPPVQPAATVPARAASSLLAGKHRAGPRTTYAKARLYARRPEDVIPLADRLRASGLETRTRMDDLARLQATDRLLGRVLAWIGAIALVGGACAFGGASWITLERKRGSLALLRLMGLTGGEILAFCLYQALLLGGVAFVIAGALYAAGSTALNHYGAELFAELLGYGGVAGALCRLGTGDALTAAAGTLGFTLLASLLGVFHAQSIQPAECLRENG